MLLQNIWVLTDMFYYSSIFKVKSSREDTGICCKTMNHGWELYLERLKWEQKGVWASAVEEILWTQQNIYLVISYTVCVIWRLLVFSCMIYTKVLDPCWVSRNPGFIYLKPSWIKSHIYWTCIGWGELEEERILSCTESRNTSSMCSVSDFQPLTQWSAAKTATNWKENKILQQSWILVYITLI